MTDLETFKAMLGRAGIKYAHEPSAEWKHPAKHPRVPGSHVDIEVGADVENEGKVDGYSSYGTSFCFDEDGSLIKVGVWEC